AGRRSAVALSAAPNAARLARFPFSFVHDGIFASQPGGRLPASRRVSSAALSGVLPTYPAHFAFHSACSFAPLSFALRKCASASGGTKNGSRVGQPRFFLLAMTSSLPSGSPCAFAVSCLFGLP